MTLNVEYMKQRVRMYNRHLNVARLESDKF
jgi:hypothetical protein